MKKRIFAAMLCAVLGISALGALTACTGEATNNESTASEVVSEVVSEADTPKLELTDLFGSYEDTYSGRATLELADVADASAPSHLGMITVHWADSASEAIEWVMTVTREDDKLTYTDCTKYRNVADANGDVESTILSENGEGYFEIDTTGETTVLKWTGAEEENCRACTFTLPSEEPTASETTSEPAESTPEATGELSVVGNWETDIGEPYGAAVQGDDPTQVLTTLHLIFTEDGKAFNVVGDLMFDYVLEDDGTLTISNVVNETDISNPEFYMEDGQLVLHARIHGGNATLTFDRTDAE